MSATQPEGLDMTYDDTIDAVSKALRRAWQLGQTYWQQADSDSWKQQDKSDETQQKFEALVDETRALLSASKPAATVHDLLATLIDVYDDGQNNAPEDRCYVEGTWKEVLSEARAYLAVPAAAPAQSGEPVAYAAPQPSPTALVLDERSQDK